MESDKDFDPNQDYKAFEITVKVHNPAYRDIEGTGIDTLYGAGYVLFVSGEGNIIGVKHGHNNSPRVVRCMVNMLNDANALPLLLVKSLERIISDEREDLAKLYLNCADDLREWLKLRQEQN